MNCLKKLNDFGCEFNCDYNCDYNDNNCYNYKLLYNSYIIIIQ